MFLLKKRSLHYTVYKLHKQKKNYSHVYNEHERQGKERNERFSGVMTVY